MHMYIHIYVCKNLGAINFLGATQNTRDPAVFKNLMMRTWEWDNLLLRRVRVQVRFKYCRRCIIFKS